MLTLNLTPIFKARGIDKPYSFLIKAGFTYSAANVILYSPKRSYKFDHIERLCKILNCTPNDIILYTPDKNELILESHPINSLNKQSTTFNLNETVKNLTLEQINQLAITLNSQQNKE